MLIQLITITRAVAVILLLYLTHQFIQYLSLDTLGAFGSLGSYLQSVALVCIAFAIPKPAALLLALPLTGLALLAISF